VLPPKRQKYDVPLSRFSQRLLTSLSPADLELLGPYLKPVEFKNETVLYAAGDKVDRVYFPHSGIISLVVELAGGQR
jgi:CRP-like cAMP-binding protein